MAEKVKLSKDGSSIDFVQSDSLPTSLKKFRQSPEIEGFYRFVFENDLQKEAFEILDRIVAIRKSKKALLKKEEEPKTSNKKSSPVAGDVKSKGQTGVASSGTSGKAVDHPATSIIGKNLKKQESTGHERKKDDYQAKKVDLKKNLKMATSTSKPKDQGHAEKSGAGAKHKGPTNKFHKK